MDLGKSDADLIHSALKEMNLSPQRSGSTIYFQGGQFNTTNGQLTLQGSNAEQRTKELKRAYSGEVVKSQAKRFGWSLTQGKEKYQYVVTKRSI